MKVFDCEQGTPEWHDARLGIITASSMKDVLAKGQEKTRDAYMRHLIGERFTGKPCKLYRNADMERGHELEPEACEVYAQAIAEEEVKTCGFIRNHDDIGGVGYSPDRLVGESGLAEIKTKEPHLQVELLEADRIPSEHIVQLQCGLWVSGRQWIDFVSYWPGMPLFCKRVHRDESMISNMRFEAIRFYAEMKNRIDNLRNRRTY